MSSLIDSKHQELSQEEIIAIATKETGSKYSVDQVKASLSLEAYEMGAVMLREGNTIFIIHQDKSNPKVGVFRALNADTIPNFIRNCVAFTQAIGMAGFQYLVTDFEEKSLLNVFKYVYRNAPFENMGYDIQKAKDRELYRVTINLGDTGKTGGLPQVSQKPSEGAL
jgi:hypothetical protein